MKQVSEEAVIALRALRASRDKDAQVLGTALLEFEIKKAGLMATRTMELESRIGALYTEFERYKAMILSRIFESHQTEKDIGSKALWSIHLNPDEKGVDYTIDLNNGIVKVMKESGEFVPVD